MDYWSLVATLPRFLQTPRNKQHLCTPLLYSHNVVFDYRPVCLFFVVGTLTSARCLCKAAEHVTVDRLLYLNYMCFYTELQRKCYRSETQWPPPDSSHSLWVYKQTSHASSLSLKPIKINPPCLDGLPNIQIMYANYCWLLLINDHAIHLTATLGETSHGNFCSIKRRATCLMNSSLYSNQLFSHVHYNEQRAARQQWGTKTQDMSGRLRIICHGFMSM